MVRGIAPRRGREEIGEPCGRTRPRPRALAMPGATLLTVKSPRAEAPPDTVAARLYQLDLETVRDAGMDRLKSL